MNENTPKTQSVKEEPFLNFTKIFQDLLKYKKLYYKVLGATFVIVAFITLSIPNYYNCTVMLAPEAGSAARSGGALAGLASSFGVNLGATNTGSDAIGPMLYPDLMNSVDFKTSLFEVPVTIEGDKEKGEADRTMSYYSYLKNERKSPWWSAAVSGIKKFIIHLFINSEKSKEKVDPFRLTPEQTEIAKAIDKNVVCDVDNKNMIITIDVTDQDPVICATMADSVKTRLQKFITDYRTSKVRNDLAYNLKILSEAKARYEKARDNYALFADTHREVSSQSAQTKRADLLNEMQIRQQIYQQIITQVQQAELKVQQETPAFTTLQSATVPVKKAGPSRAMLCIIFLFLAFLSTTVWILHKEGDLKPLLGFD
jgi:hypothetical protein